MDQLLNSAEKSKEHRSIIGVFSSTIHQLLEQNAELVAALAAERAKSSRLESELRRTRPRASQLTAEKHELVEAVSSLSAAVTAQTKTHKRLLRRNQALLQQW